ncbi:Protein of unknown function [Pyronema omphalodes CBS 100304]|uniref:Uncharacterized protein n=1 Tax=Pyronema omphalodes (strain CBS 100304) TaxID=1076935 RepID=U4LGM6_PYROM|nr:Protein of unknown function [Pyronema omphalodes CBS 100304]
MGTLAAVGLYKDSVHPDETVVVIHNEPGTSPGQHEERPTTIHSERPATGHSGNAAGTTGTEPVTDVPEGVIKASGTVVMVENEHGLPPGVREALNF